jgi:hypothetical protein
MPQAKATLGSFFRELGPWIDELSVGGKLRVLALTLLMLWIAFIAVPTTTFTAVSSTFLATNFNNPQAGPTLPSSSGSRGGFPNLVALFQASPTPKPTARPSPTATTRPVVAAPRPPQPTLAPIAAPVASVPKASLPSIEWDNRLGPNGIDKVTYPDLEGVRIVPVSSPVASGQKFWRVVRVKFEGFGESGNDHTVYVKILGEDGKRVDGKKLRLNPPLDKMEEKPASDVLCDCNYSVLNFGSAPEVSVDDQYPSETVAGMCLCGIKDVFKGHAHVNYRLTFQLVTMP